MSHTCPQCSSASVMSKRAIHLNGTTATNSTTMGVGAVGMGHLGAGVATQSGVSASALAVECAPPAPKLTSPGSVAFFTFIATFIGCAFVMETRALYWAYVAGAVAAFVYFGTKRGNAKAITDNEPKLAQYEKEWRCLTCAHTFVPATGTPPL